MPLRTRKRKKKSADDRTFSHSKSLHKSVFCSATILDKGCHFVTRYFFARTIGSKMHKLYSYNAIFPDFAQTSLFSLKLSFSLSLSLSLSYSITRKSKTKREVPLNCPAQELSHEVVPNRFVTLTFTYTNSNSQPFICKSNK